MTEISGYHLGHLQGIIEQQRDEIERLKADWKPDRGSLVEYQLLAEAQADNDRLRAATSEAINELSDPADACDFPSEADALRATMRAAAGHLRRALEPKP